MDKILFLGIKLSMTIAFRLATILVGGYAAALLAFAMFQGELIQVVIAEICLLVFVFSSLYFGYIVFMVQLEDRKETKIRPASRLITLAAILISGVIMIVHAFQPGLGLPIQVASLLTIVLVANFLGGMSIQLRKNFPLYFSKITNILAFVIATGLPLIPVLILSLYLVKGSNDWIGSIVNVVVLLATYTVALIPFLGLIAKENK